MSYDYYNALSKQPRWEKEILNRFPEVKTQSGEEEKN